MTNLLPCPFCGNSATVELVDEIQLISCDCDCSFVDEPYLCVVCSVNEMEPVPGDNWKPGCGASGGYRKTKEEAIEAWNRRATGRNGHGCTFKDLSV